MLKEFLIKNILFKKRMLLLDIKKQLYGSVTTKESINDIQLTKFNSQWKFLINHNPFYKHWKKINNLPNQISSLDEINSFPVLTKKIVQENQDLIFKNLKSFDTISTGGSSGEPVTFPLNNLEKRNNYVNIYLGRSWWGVNPLENSILIWGHSHLFGAGVMGKINKQKRIIYDKLINVKRLSAYNLSLKNLSKYSKIIINSKATSITGYSSALFKILKHLQEAGLKLINNNLKAVFLTSETVSNIDISLVENVLKTKCVIEYGMAEAGVIAYSKKATNSINVFWDSFILHQTNNIAHLTTIDEKLFPLINYSTDDLIETKNNDFSILEIKRINGRRHDFIEILIKNKYTPVHGEIFTHIIKTIKGVSSFQIIQKKNKDIIINYIAKNQINISNMFFNELIKEFTSFDKKQFKFIKVNFIAKTISGKHNWIKIEK
jgi:phenylacetate-coenzyme A ligase PaaK-like adenylate-forming protein